MKTSSGHIPLNSINGNEARALTADLASELLESGNDLRVRVTGNSMKPYLKDGDIATIRKMPVEALTVGDIIFCNRDKDGMTLHRLLKIVNRRPGYDDMILYTKGDAVDTMDAPFSSGQFLGRAVYVEKKNNADVITVDLLSRKAILNNLFNAWFQRFRIVIIRYAGAVRGRGGSSSNRFFQGYVLSLLTRQPFSPPLDWRGFPRFLIDEHLPGLFYRLAGDQFGVPAPVKVFAEQAYYATFAANTVRIEHIKELEQKLSVEKIDVLVLKGAALLDRIYEDPGTRSMEDIDLLVRFKDMPLLESILTQCGYESEPYSSTMFRKNDILIDVHTTLMHTRRISSRHLLFPIDQQQVFNDAVPWRQDFCHVLSPEDATHLIYMAHHMTKHSFSKLIWLIDFYRIIRGRDHRFWENFENRVVQYHQEKPLAYVFSLMEGMFHFVPPDWTVFRQYASNLSRIERALLKLRLKGKSMGDMGNLLWINCLPSPRERLALLRETVFPDVVVLQREYPWGRNSNRKGLLLFRYRRIIQRLWLNLGVVVKAVTLR